jgi:signal transduction histidine kinase/HPt (histidine-containing phosphotransfer) domain-containing protein
MPGRDDARAQVHPVDGEPTRALPGGGLRVLLVEDDPRDARASMAHLGDGYAGAGLDVIHVGSVADALARLARPPAVDVVLLDLGLPDCQGLDGLAAVRAGAPEVPVLILTSNEDDDLAHLALVSGAQDYLYKRTTDGPTLSRAIAFARARQERGASVERARQQAVNANLAKTDLLANVSHEIRTPLGTILGMAELMGETRLLPEQARYLGTLQRAGAHLLSLADDVLDLSRIEADGLTLEKSAFDLTRVVDSAVDFLRPAARRKGLALRVDWSPDIHRMVLGDTRRLRQILVNLLANGVKFTSKGSVRLAVSRDPMRDIPGALRISVEDTGIGIASDRIDAIFGSFVQGDPSIARHYGGAGLGLHIVKRLVELMGGRISAESTLGVGSSFHTQLILEPADQIEVAPVIPATAAPSDPQLASGDLAGLRVLLVDDSEESRALVEAYLAPTAATLDVAGDASTALGMLQHRTFDVVLMDLHLPDMDGFTATQELRRREETRGGRTTPVVALSADVLAVTVRKALAAGFTEHLAKPIGKADLVGLLRRYAQGASARPLSPAVPALLPKFISNRERDTTTLRGALAREDFETVVTLGHNMRGNGVSYGFPEVSAIGHRLESAGLSRSSRGAEEQLEKLEAWVARNRASEVDDAGGAAPPSPRPRSRSSVRSPSDKRSTGRSQAAKK